MAVTLGTGWEAGVDVKAELPGPLGGRGGVFWRETERKLASLAGRGGLTADRAQLRHKVCWSPQAPDPGVCPRYNLSVGFILPLWLTTFLNRQVQCISYFLPFQEASRLLGG